LPGLLVQRRHTQTLLVERGVFRDQRMLRIRDERDAFRASCIKLVESSPTVERMNIQPAP
ncbi:MAG: hypothetical protein K0U93_08790, partial [Gammaproteobacteria bacterium]|nr:hypothetical protein [Gammaproteobacteria bacterium]